MKSNKSFLKRLRVTRTGKVLARKPGHNHFNAKESGSKTMSKRRVVNLALSNKIRRRFLPST
jgi:ribosomal protein L35